VFFSVPAARRRLTLALGLALALALPACSRSDGRIKVYPVHGKVLVKGKPPVEAIVRFHPADGNTSDPHWIHGQVDGEGRFALSTYVTGDGAPAGEYVVTIEWNERSGPLKTEFTGPDRLKGRYKDPKTSKIRFRVEAQPLNEMPAIEL
jgi:hypothetical protein